jgi:hypothetical protein
VVAAEHQPDQLGPPVGVPPALVHRGADQVVGRPGGGAATAVISGRDAVAAVPVEAPQQAADGAHGQAQGGGNGGRGLVLPPALEHGTADGDGESAGHRETSRRVDDRTPLLYPGRPVAAKLKVRISMAKLTDPNTTAKPGVR